MHLYKELILPQNPSCQGRGIGWRVLRTERIALRERRVKRWEHEAVLEAAQERLDKKPDMMTVRRSTVEHPFGTLKFWMGSAHFLMKKLRNVKTEMSLHVLSYNMKRVMNIPGVPGLLQAMRACA